MQPLCEQEKHNLCLVTCKDDWKIRLTWRQIDIIMFSAKCSAIITKHLLPNSTLSGTLPTHKGLCLVEIIAIPYYDLVDK